MTRSLRATWRSGFLAFLLLGVQPAAAQPAATPAADTAGATLPFFSLPKRIERAAAPGLPVRSTADLAALLPGVDRVEGSDDLVLRAVPGRAAYYLDGMPLPAGWTVPWHAVASVEVLDGHVPARYGQALGGIVAVETQPFAGVGPAAQRGLGLRAEGLTSRGLDAFGHSMGALSFGGGAFGGRLRLFAAAEAEQRGDADPRATPALRVRDDLLRSLHASPQAVRAIDRATGEAVLVPLPADVEPGTSVDEVTRRLREAGYDVTPSYPRSLAQAFADDAFEETAARPHNDLTAGRLFARVDALLGRSLHVAAGGEYAAHRRNHHDPAFTLLADAPYARTEGGSTRLFATLAQQITEQTRLSLSASYARLHAVTHDPRFSTGVEDVASYGDLDHPANALAARYLTLFGDEYRRRFTTDGTMPVLGTEVNYLLAAPGAVGAGYRKEDEQQFWFSVEASRRFSIHTLSVGATFEQHTARLWEARDVAGLARFLDDGSCEQPPCVARYDELPFNALRERVTYYGYDFRGLDEVDDEDIQGYYDRTHLDVAPRQPISYAGYLQDRIAYRDLTLDLGVRVEVFDNNATVLLDPWVPFPAVRVRDLEGTTAPPGIDEDAAVYFNGDGNVVGYRDREGQFYDTDGSRTDFNAVRNRAGQVRPTDAPITAAFTDYNPRVVVMPRLGVHFTASPETDLFAYYDVLARRPDAAWYGTFRDYEEVTAGDVVGTANLDPERVYSYGLGARQALAPATSLTAQGYLRSYKDLIGLRRWEGGYPAYTSYANLHHGVVMGLEMAIETRHPAGLRLGASYTLQSARLSDVIGADASLLLTLPPTEMVWAEQDRRHQVKLLLGYQVGAGEGPVLFGRHLLAGFSASLFADLKSGRPYTAREVAFSSLFDTFTGNVRGSVHGQRMPWSTLVNLRLAHRFAVAGAGLTAYLWVQNVLDAENVLDVYDTTGKPGDDGWLGSTGRYWLDTTDFPDAAAFQYRYRLRDPQHYGLPRLIRLGLELAF